MCGSMDGPEGLSVAAVHGLGRPLIRENIGSVTGVHYYMNPLARKYIIVTCTSITIKAK